MGKRKLPWITDYKPTEWVKYCKKDEILNGIETLNQLLFSKIDHRYVKMYVENIAQEPEPIHQNYISVKSAVKAINHGHVDLSVFMYVNPLVKFRTPDKGWQFSWHLSHNTDNFILDLDCCIYDTVEELLFVLMDRKCPLPLAIVTTSERSYHLLYKGNAGDWSKPKRIALVRKLTKCPTGLTSTQEEECFTKFGIDVGHLKRDAAHMKLRMPGTINYRKSNGLTGKVTITSLWVNPETTNPKGLKLIKASDRVITVNREREYLYSTKKKIEFLLEKFRQQFREDDSKIYSEILGLGWKRLYNNNCRIFQLWWGQILGVEQFQVSRLLARLVKKGYIVVIKEYRRGYEARTYGAGPAMLALMKEFYGIQKRFDDYDIHLLYQDGYVNDHWLEDLRALAWRGWTESDTVNFIQSKQKDRPLEVQRHSSVIRGSYRRHMAWLRKEYPQLFKVALDRAM